jgi:hypothetical protein
MKSSVVHLVYLISIALLATLLFVQQGRIQDLRADFEEEKVLFDARFGEVVRLNDEIGEYKDSCFIYRKQIRALEESAVK